jgi:abortive infection bacteriophage resistance protein
MTLKASQEKKVKIPFIKPSLTYSEQVDLLEKRGMIISDRTRAEFYLEHINYYRLTAYWLPFEADHATHQFKPNTHFDEVIRIYQFDQSLRLLVQEAIERIEISVRGHWAHQMAQRHGTHSHLDPSLAVDVMIFASNINGLKKETERSDEKFIRHMRETYKEPLPPIWAVCEVMSLGLLSKCYKNLKPMATRSAISKSYGLDEEVFSSWLHLLTQVRNVTAHHARLWNRHFRIKPEVPKTTPIRVVEAFLPKSTLFSNRLYNPLLIMLHFMDVIEPGHTWRDRLKELLTQHPHLLPDMGFPDAWVNKAIWKGPSQ